MTARQVWKEFGISPKVLKAWREQKTGPKHRMVNGEAVYSHEDVVSYLNKLRAAGGPKPEGIPF